MSYHFATRLQSLQSTLPYVYFASDKALSRRNIPKEVATAIGRCHDFVIGLGHPIALRKLVPHFEREDRELTQKIMSDIVSLGVQDQFMVPVFGPYGVNAVVSYGFPDFCDNLDRQVLSRLDHASYTAHRSIVRYFGRPKSKVSLSNREQEVLKWMSRGKSRSDIATILDLKTSSIDTYTRRIFSKLGVNDRVSATLKALQHGVLDYAGAPAA